MKTWIVAAALGIVLPAAGASGALAQAGSTGGTLGQTDKSISGERKEEPPATAKAARKPETTHRVATLKSMGCGRIAGNWNWVFNGQVFFKPDGSYSYDVAGNSGTGRWTCSNGNHYVLRSGANEDRMDLAEDGNTMTGVSSVTGFTIGFTVHRK